MISTNSKQPGHGVSRILEKASRHALLLSLCMFGFLACSWMACFLALHVAPRTLMGLDKPESASLAWRELASPTTAYEQAQHDANLELARIVSTLDMPTLNEGLRYAVVTTPTWSHPNSHALPIGPLCFVRHEMLPDGTLFLQSMLAGAMGNQARDFAMAFATAHEAAHCSFDRLDGAGNPTTLRAVIGSTRLSQEADFASLWLSKTWNESYADIIALAYVAQKFPPEIFDAGASALMGKRVSGHIQSVASSILSAPKGFQLDYSELDSHATQFAISEALRLGQKGLAKLEGRELERWALDASRESTMNGMLAAHGALGFLKEARPASADFKVFASQLSSTCFSCARGHAIPHP